MFPAVGTPLDKDGNLCIESYKNQIEDQILHGAIAILSMGSMADPPPGKIRQICAETGSPVWAMPCTGPSLWI